MLTFKNLCIDDKELFDKYTKPYIFNTCEYSFTNLYLWRKGCNIAYTIYKETLIIKKSGFDGSSYFMQPLHYKLVDLKEIVKALMEYKEANDMDYLFKDVETPFIEDLKKIYGEAIITQEDRDNFDYIYESKNLISLSGKKFHGPKGHYNYFIKNFNYGVSDNSENIACECIKTARQWCNKNSCSGYLLFELKGIEDLLRNKNRLDYDCMGVYIDDKMVAFTIGEKVREDLAIIHVEKADSEIKGLYSYINKTFVEKYYKDVTYINREQDLGIEGLRNVKMAYNPSILEKKYIIENI